MRKLKPLSLALAIVAAGAAGAAAQTSDSVNASAAARPITLRSADGVAVQGSFYPAPMPKALILLFHQAGSSKGEYATIAPRLAGEGYSALAIDQRSGGGLFGRNETAASLRRPA